MLDATGKNEFEIKNDQLEIRNKYTKNNSKYLT